MRATPSTRAGARGGSSESVTLFSRGQPVPANLLRTSCAGPGLQLDFPASLAADGWEALASNFSWRPPPRLRVEVSSDSERWRDADVPRWARVTGPPGGGGSGWERVAWDLRPDWQWVLDWCVMHNANTAVSYASLAVGLAVAGQASTVIFGAGFALYGAALLVILASRRGGLAPVAHLGDGADLPAVTWIRVAFTCNVVLQARNGERGETEALYILYFFFSHQGEGGREGLLTGR